MADLNRNIVQDREQTPVAESFRAIRAKILAAQTKSEGELKVILFAGASQGDGSAMVAVNTAVTLAYAGKKVVLVDCDLRNPMIHDVFGCANQGIADIVKGDVCLEECLQLSPIANLQILTCGAASTAPIEVLSSRKMREIIGELKENADYVCVTSSPMIVVSKQMITDACILAGKVDGVLLAMPARNVPVKTARKVLALLKGAKANVLGVVLNDVNDDKEYAY